jgi:hypothetical protein
MRTFGFVLLAAGILEAGKLELGRYAAAMAGFIGLLLAFFPQGR